jgi:hypothetical protein
MATLWVVFAAVAIVSGWVAVQMVGNAVTPASIPVLSAAEVSQRLATSAPSGEATPTRSPNVKNTKDGKDPKPSSSATQKTSPSPGSTTATSKPPAPTAVVRTLASKGGSVVAACRSGQVTLRSWSPAVGFRVDEVDAGPGGEAEIRFVSRTAEVKMQLRCVSGAPVAQTEYDSESGDDD